MTTYPKKSAKTTTTRWTRFRFWLANILVGRLEFELRHGAARHRARIHLTPFCQRLDIPLEKKTGVVDGPYGRMTTDQVQELINHATGVEGEIYPGFEDFDPKNGDTITKVCPFCGNERKDVL